MTEDLIIKPAYQTDRAGVFVGVVMAERDPRDPSHWLVPGGAREDAPPAFSYGQRARLVKGAWVVEDAPATLTSVDFGNGVVAAAGVLVAWDGEARDTLNVTPPPITDMQTAEWDGKRWLVADKPAPEVQPEQPTLTRAT